MGGDTSGAKAPAVDHSSPVNWGREVLASVVVFLVALPLCMGIAIASGVDPALGLISGIIGGLVIAPIAGSPLQVSGPAAGLVVLVADLINDFGIGALGVAVLASGVLQIIAARLSMGRWFRATSPSVILGMLGGIGVLILAGQFHVMIDDTPHAHGLENIATIPEALYKAIFPLDGSVHHMAAAVGLLTIFTIVLWDTFKPRMLAAIPGALLGVVAGTVAAMVMGLPINLVNVPSNLMDAISLPSTSSLLMLTDMSYLGAILALAVIASAESLLSASAVDKMHTGPRANYDRELLAQGVGNTVAGLVGALPLTGVIVRSSANVLAGARTRVSAILHAVWLLALVLVFPFILTRIPTACLGAVLVYTGYKLINPKALLALWKSNRLEFGILMATLLLVVVEDLLIGVVAGVVLTATHLFWRLSHLHIERELDDDGTVILHLAGTATFVTLPRLAEALEKLPRTGRVEISVHGLSFLDHACHQEILEWQKQAVAAGVEVMLNAPVLAAKVNSREAFGSYSTTSIVPAVAPVAP